MLRFLRDLRKCLALIFQLCSNFIIFIDLNTPSQTTMTIGRHRTQLLLSLNTHTTQQQGYQYITKNNHSRLLLVALCTTHCLTCLEKFTPTRPSHETICLSRAGGTPRSCTSCRTVLVRATSAEKHARSISGITKVQRQLGTPRTEISVEA